MERTQENKRRSSRRLWRGLLAVTLVFSAASCASESDDIPLGTTTSTTNKPSVTSCGMMGAVVELMPSLHVGIDDIPRLLGEKGAVGQAEDWENIEEAVEDWRAQDIPAGAQATVGAEVAFDHASEADAERTAGRLAVLASEELSLPIGEPTGTYHGGDGVATLHFFAYAGGTFDTCRL